MRGTAGNASLSPPGRDEFRDSGSIIIPAGRAIATCSSWHDERRFYGQLSPTAEARPGLLPSMSFDDSRYAMAAPQGLQESVAVLGSFSCRIPCAGSCGSAALSALLDTSAHSSPA